MSLPRLTIVTPSLNQGRYLERTLRSVLEQGYPNLEYIVIDGGSTDETVSVLERYDDRLAYWVSEPDRGQTEAINKGLARATGEIVAYINSDDYYLPGAFEAAAALFADEGVSWVAGACRFLHADGTLETVWTPKLPRRRRLNWIVNYWSVPQAASFWRRGLFDRFGSFREDLHYVFDTEFMLRLAVNGVLPRTTERELAVRFLHEEAKSADLRPFQGEGKRMVRDLVRTLTPAERVGYRVRYPYWEWQARRALGKARLVLGRPGAEA